MPENKTQPTAASINQFLAALPDAQQRQDSQTLVDLMSKAAHAEPKLWGSNIVGFGQYHYVYESGREGDSMLVGFSPRKPALTLYVGASSPEQQALLETLGKYKTGKGCLYIKKLEDVHLPTLKKMIAQAVKQSKQKNQSK